MCEGLYFRRVEDIEGWEEVEEEQNTRKTSSRLKIFKN